MYMKVSSDEDGRMEVSPYSHLIRQESRPPAREACYRQVNQQSLKDETDNNNITACPFSDSIKVIIEPCLDSDDDVDKQTVKIPRIIPEIQLTPASYDAGKCGHSLTIPPRDPGRFFRPEGEALRTFNFDTNFYNADGTFLSDPANQAGNQDVQKTGSYLKDQIISFFQVSDNKLALKLFGNRNALLKEKLRQKAVGDWIIHPCSSFSLKASVRKKRLDVIRMFTKSRIACKTRGRVLSLIDNMMPVNMCDGRCDNTRIGGRSQLFVT